MSGQVKAPTQLDRKLYDGLVKRAEKYIEQAMTSHTCGGPGPWAFSSDCIGCCPDTTQHYRNAAETVIAWTGNEWRKLLEASLPKEIHD